MSQHYKWYPDSTEVVVPWNARYSFPSQTNKAIKLTPRIPPKNGAQFKGGDIIRLEFPAQGYVNTAHTTSNIYFLTLVEFDVLLCLPATVLVGGGNNGTGGGFVRFQNNIQSIFNRIRILYGGNPIEDIQRSDVIVRMLTEATTSNGAIFDQTSIADGIGGSTLQPIGGDNTTILNSADNNIRSEPWIYAAQMVNVRQNYIQGIWTDPKLNDTTLFPLSYVPNKNTGNSLFGNFPFCTRRYQIQLPCGLFQQGKLIPCKYMASQFAIEITLNQPSTAIMMATNNWTSAQSFIPLYQVTNVNLIPEILEFDPSYGIV